jgi:hypothetical protein
MPNVRKYIRQSLLNFPKPNTIKNKAMKLKTVSVSLISITEQKISDVFCLSSL